MNKVGIYFAFWEKEWSGDYIAHIKNVKKLGFDVLEIAAGAIADMSDAELIEIAEAAKQEDIKLTYCIGLPPEYDVSSTDEFVRTRGVAYVKKILHAIYVMGGDTLGGIIYSCWPATNMSLEYKNAARKQALKSVKDYAGFAEDYGITCCMEIVNRFEQCILNTAQEGLDFIEEVGSPNVKLLLDTFHMNIEEDFIGDAIRSAKGKIGHFHIGECNRKTPGLGHMPWDEIFTALKDIKYNGAIVMEPFIKPGGQVGQDIKVFHDLSNNASDKEMNALAKNACEFVKSKIER